MEVTSGLPLVMVKGKFMSLYTMSVEDLETFIPFMAQCSVQRASAATVNDTPIWWHSSVDFQFPLKKPCGLSFTGYRRHLVSIVCRCYYYHDEQYILRFCNQVAQNPESVVMKDNGDDTTSLYYSKSLLHILTFNNQNQNYDKPRTEANREPPKSPRRCLLPSKPAKPITDVYLCENCDAEFTTQAAISGHERQCYGLTESAEPELTPADLLGYLHLGTGPPPSLSQPPRPLELSLLKNRLVEFSSLLGRRILSEGLAKRDLVTKPEKLIQGYEAYCFVSPRINKSRESYELRTSYRTLAQSQEPSYCRPYCFSRAERLERYRTLKTGLDRRSRELAAQCKPCSVPIIRWKPPKALPPPPPPLITLADSEELSPTPPESAACSVATPMPVTTLILFLAEPVSLVSASTSEPQFVDLCSSDDE